MTLIRLQARLTRARRRSRRRLLPKARAVASGAAALGAATAASEGPTAVPWEVERGRNSQVTALTNVSDRALRHVRLALCGGTQLAITLPVLVTPGQRLVVWGDKRIAGVVASPDAMWVVRWVSDTDQELLWPIPAL